MAVAATQPLDSAAIFKQAQQQINAETASQTGPLQTQITGLGGKEKAAVGAIGSMFNAIDPTVQAGATAVQQGYDQAEVAQNQIFSAAQKRMSDLKGARAAEAQRLAQEMGGPVAVGEFTAGWDPAIESLTQLGAGSQLHTLGYAQAGEQAAQAFAGQVFPLVRTEQVAQARRYYEDQIKDLNDQITKVNAQKGGLVNARFTDLQKAALDSQVQQATLKLNKLNSDRDAAEQIRQYNLESKKADRDWKQALHIMANDDQRLQLSKDQFALTHKVTMTKLELAKQQLTDQEKQYAMNHDLSLDQLALRKVALAASTKHADAVLDAAKNTEAAQWLEAAINPQPGKTVTHSTVQPVDHITALSGSGSSIFKDKDSPTGYARIVKTVETAETTPITDPTLLVKYLVSHSVGRTKAISMVKSRLNLPTNWTPKS